MSGLPSKEQILAFIRENPSQVSRREIARAFGIKGDDRATLRTILKELEEEGAIDKGERNRFGVPDSLAPVGIVRVTDIDPDGEVIATPVEWSGDTAPPRILMKPEKRGHPALSPGDRVLARLNRSESEDLYEGRTIRRLDQPTKTVLGQFMAAKAGGKIKSVEKRARDEYLVRPADRMGAENGQLVIAEPVPSRRGQAKTARVTEILDEAGKEPSPSVIAIHSHDLRVKFPGAAEAETKGARVPRLGKREDLRQTPLVTIDGADAKDFDDAVFAEPDEDPANRGGFHLIVAIADVAHYVRPGSALDDEAQRRGNSTYFPDRVVPMLPEALSNDLCSLRPGRTRASLAIHLWIDAEGRLKRHRVSRALMKSRARLVYEEVQAAKDGQPNRKTKPLLEPVIEPLYAAFQALLTNRAQRGTLDLDLPERQVAIDENGLVHDLVERERLDSHRLIEEFMICANVAAAEALEAVRHPCVYRVHDRPDPEKLESVRQFVRGLGLNLAKGQVIQPKHLTNLLRAAEAQGYGDLVSELILRSQSQAVYSTQNIGHFGLALRRYAHFTSPIRRYADLLVHRALIRAYRLGSGELDSEIMAGLDDLATHISRCERKSMQAERDANDRFTAQWLAKHRGEEFDGRITGVTRFGLFVKLGDTGADGLIPVRSLKEDYYEHDSAGHALIGRRWGRVFRLGAQVRVRIVEADPMTGSTLLDLIGQEEAELPGLEQKPASAAKPAPARRTKAKRGHGKTAKRGGQPGKSRANR